MPQLNQIIAIEKGEKNKALQFISELYKNIQKNAGFAGLVRAYSPAVDGGDPLPREQTLVQQKANKLLAEMVATQATWFDITATKDYTNCAATADVVVDGVTILKDVPVTFLLFLEKQLVHWHTFVSKLPILDSADQWTYDTNQDCWATAPTETVRNIKVKKVLELAPATDKHAAQVQVVEEDLRAGTWKQIKFSGAMPATDIRDLLDKLDKLQNAVKFAREKANGTEAVAVKVGDALSTYLLGK
jgi:hypothetical protein